MPETATHAPSAPCAPPTPAGPRWLVFCVLACSLFSALFGRLVPSTLAQASLESDASGDNPFAFLLQLIAIDWFRRFRSAPATLEELLRRSRIAQAVLSQPPASIQPCDRPGETPAAGVFAPAFLGQLAAAPNAPLALTPSSCLNACFATLSTASRSALSACSRALFDEESLPGVSATPSNARSEFGIDYSAFHIPHSAFPRAPV